MVISIPYLFSVLIALCLFIPPASFGFLPWLVSLNVFFFSFQFPFLFQIDVRDRVKVLGQVHVWDRVKVLGHSGYILSTILDEQFLLEVKRQWFSFHFYFFILVAFCPFFLFHFSWLLPFLLLFSFNHLPSCMSFLLFRPIMFFLFNCPSKKSFCSLFLCGCFSANWFFLD